MVFPGGLQGSGRKQRPEGLGEKTSLALEKVLQGPRGHSLPPLGSGWHFWRDQTRKEGSPGFEQRPHLLGQARRDAEPSTRGGQARAWTPRPAHLSRAQLPHGHCDLVPPCRPLCQPERQLAGSQPTLPGPARPCPAPPLAPVVPGRQRLRRRRRRRRRRCSSRTRFALPRSPRTRSPLPGGGSSSLRAPAASCRQH
jgi:hypothetical protein